MNLPCKRFKDTQTCYFDQELRSLMSSEDSWDSFEIGVTTKIPVLGQELTWPHRALGWQQLEAVGALQAGGSRGKQESPWECLLGISKDKLWERPSQRFLFRFKLQLGGLPSHSLAQAFASSLQRQDGDEASSRLGSWAPAKCLGQSLDNFEPGE